MKQRGSSIGIAWYTREQWLKLRTAASDPEVMDATYEEWFRSASQTLDDLADRGMVPEQVFIDVDELSRWCREHTRPNDMAARADFAARKVQELHRFRKT
jgi:hypothetical protein